VDPTTIPLCVSIPVSDHPVLSTFVCQHSATGLISADMGGTSDPLGQIELGPMVFKTDHIVRNLSPEWNEVSRFQV
jgi:Ca2+-dependent lipid-binding protein